MASFCLEGGDLVVPMVVDDMDAAEEGITEDNGAVDEPKRAVLATSSEMVMVRRLAS